MQVHLRPKLGEIPVIGFQGMVLTRFWGSTD